MFKDFDVAFQPIYRTGSDDIFGFEVLLRSDIPPTELFSRAKTVGDYHLLDRQSRSLASQNFHLSNSTLFLNSHPLTVLYDEYFHQDIYDLLHNNNVVVEITEQEIPDFGLLQYRVAQLREMGAHVALDDFGTGYTNFQTLRYIQPDFLKIDRSYIESLTTDLTSKQITDFILRYATDLECQIVVEGIEDFDQLNYVSGNNVGYAQGYLLGVPVLSGEFRGTYC